MLIYVLQIDLFCSFFACSQNSLELNVLLKKVTSGAAKILEEFIKVFYEAYLIVVSQQSHSLFVFQHTSCGKFSDNFSIPNIYIIQQNDES